MRFPSKTVLGLLVAGLLASAMPGFTAEGRTPIWQPTVIPAVATAGSKYIVTRDIFGLPGAPVIDVLPGIAAVDIDLNGFTLYGADMETIRAIGVSTVTIRNGTIIGGQGDAIRVMDARKAVIEDVKIEAAGGRGIGLYEVKSFAVRRNVIFETALEGIYVDGAFLDPTIPVDGSIEDNLVRETEGGITVYFGSSVAVLNNRIEQSRANGIFVSPGPAGPPYGCIACLVSENTIQEAAGNGMWLSHFESSKVYNNAVTFSRQEGIWLDVLSDDNLVLDNVSSQNGANGLLVFSNQNHLERNVLNTNGLFAPPGWGMYLQGFANVYRGNLARGNLGGPCPGFPATPDFCDATGGANTSPFNQPPALAGDNLMPGLL